MIGGEELKKAKRGQHEAETAIAEAPVYQERKRWDVRKRWNGQRVRVSSV